MNKFEQGANRLDKVSRILGAELKAAMQNIFGESRTLHLVENAYKDYPMMARVDAAKSDEELLALYKKAAENITKINAENFHKDALTDLSQKLYDASYGFIVQNPELNRIRGQWRNATIEQRKYFCNAVVDNLSRAFDVPRPELFFQEGRQLPVNGFSYDGTIFMNIGDGAGAPGLIVHEFTHHLQSHGKTPMGRDVVRKTRENYVLSAFLPADKRDKFRDFVFNNIYSNSLLEREAVFTGDWVKQHFKEMQGRAPSRDTQDSDIILKINKALKKTNDFFESVDEIPQEIEQAAQNSGDRHLARNLWLSQHTIKPNQNMFSFSAEDIEMHKIPSYVVGCSGRANMFAKYAAELGLKDVFVVPTVKISDIGKKHMDGHQIIAVKTSNGLQLINPGRGRNDFEHAFVAGVCKIGVEVDATQHGVPEYKITAILTPEEHAKIDSYSKLHDVYAGRHGTDVQRMKFSAQHLQDDSMNAAIAQMLVQKKYDA